MCKEARHVIFAELYWTPGVLLQAEDRIIRMGQLDPVQIDYLYANHTADYHILNIVKEKLGLLIRYY